MNVRAAIIEDMAECDGSKLFRPVEPFHQFPFNLLSASFASLGWAYKDSAQILAKEFRKGGIRPGSEVLFPMVYLYRHSIELFLKAILIFFGGDIGVTRDAVIGRSHSLVKHLEDIDKLSDQFASKLSPSIYERIRDLDSTDPDSMRFRYPESREGTPYLTTEQASFDVGHFITVADEVVDALIEFSSDLEFLKTQEIIKEECSNEDMNPFELSDDPAYPRL